MAQLKHLSIDALRGSTRKFDLQFEQGKKITIIYGENGTGKSTICDALDFIGKGTVGSLDDRGLGTTYRFWPASGHSAEDINVTLATTKGQWCAKLYKNKVSINPRFDAPQVQVLRRRQIITLMEAKPGDRFEVIRPFIDLDAIEESEKSLRELIRSEKQSSAISIARLAENRGIIDSLWQRAQRPGADSVSWARQESSRDQSELRETLAALEQLQKSLATAWRQKERVEGIQAENAKLSEQLKLSAAALQRTQAQFATEVPEVVRLLLEAKNYFSISPNPQACPLCGSNEFANDLSTKINQRLNSIQELNQAIQTSEKNAQNLQYNKRQLHTETTQLVECVIKSILELATQQLPAGLMKPNVPNDWNSILHDSTIGLADRTTVACAIVNDLEGFVLRLGNEIENRKQRQGAMSALKVAVQQYDESLLTERTASSILPALNRALEIVEEERKAHTAHSLTQISTRVGELYEKIHPGEGLSKISLQLDPKKRASLEIASKTIHASDAPPQAFLSESHLDTLGLCIFLAVAELSDAENTILVLDDVVASIDEPHVDRVIRMLYDVAKHFSHCIITTHYRPWREKYRWGWLAEGECQFVELRRWSFQEGMAHTRSIMRVEDLRGHLNQKTPDVQVICSSAGVLLEAMLDFLTELYECSVPRKKGKLTLGDLLPAVDKKKLRPALRADRMLPAVAGKSCNYESKQLVEILDELERIAQVRNVVGCHFNDLSYDLLESDGVHFGALVLELADWIIDPQCGWPRSDKSGSYWATNGETRRLHPLKRPS